MAITRRRVFVPVPRIDIGGVVTALLPWGTHKPASRVTDVRGKYSGYSGTHGDLCDYDQMTTAQHDQAGEFWAVYLGDL